MLTNNSTFKYETPYTCPFDIKQYCTNGTVTLQCGAIKLGILYIKLNHINLIQMLRISLMETNVMTSHYNIPVI